MKYPKPLMSLTDLVSLGHSEKILRRIYDTQGYPIAFKEDVNSRNAQIKFDTAELEKYLRRINTIYEEKRGIHND